MLAHDASNQEEKVYVSLEGTPQRPNLTPLSAKNENPNRVNGCSHLLQGQLTPTRKPKKPSKRRSCPNDCLIPSSRAGPQVGPTKKCTKAQYLRETGTGIRTKPFLYVKCPCTCIIVHVQPGTVRAVIQTARNTSQHTTGRTALVRE